MEKEKLYKKWFKDTDRYNSDYVKNFIDENGKHIDIAWVQSGRGRGKSFDISAKALADAWFSNGEKTFGYIRRYDKELTMVNVEQYFEDKKDFIKDMTNGECNRVVCKNKKIYLAKDFLDDNEKVKTELIMLVGYSFALNLANQYKSLQYPTIVTMIFEEVLSRSTYIQNEPLELLSLISTCRRDKELFTCFCITNTVSRVNPYSESFGFDLRSLKEGQQTFTRLYSGEYDENKKMDEYYLISVEYLKAKDKMKKSTKKASNVIQSITTNNYDIAQLYKTLNFDIFKKLATDKKFPYAIFNWNGMRFKCVIMEVNCDLLEHIENDKSMGSDTMPILYIFPIGKNNIEKGTRTYSNQLKLDKYTTRTIDNTFMIDKVIRELYNRDWVLYSDNGTANDFNQIFINFI